MVQEYYRNEGIFNFCLKLKKHVINCAGKQVKIICQWAEIMTHQSKDLLKNISFNQSLLFCYYRNDVPFSKTSLANDSNKSNCFGNKSANT